MQVSYKPKKTANSDAGSPWTREVITKNEDWHSLEEVNPAWKPVAFLFTLPMRDSPEDFYFWAADELRLFDKNNSAD